MPIDVHEDVDAIGRNLAGGLIVTEIADVGPMFDGGFDAIGERALRWRAAIIGENFDVTPAMELKNSTIKYPMA
jgi:hypothetical protein